MLEPARSSPRTGSPARVLPRDDKIRLAETECQRDLEAALQQLQRFRELWFVEDPPRRDDARGILSDLMREVARIRNAILELKRQVDPLPA